MSREVATVPQMVRSATGAGPPGTAGHRALSAVCQNPHLVLQRHRLPGVGKACTTPSPPPWTSVLGLVIVVTMTRTLPLAEVKAHLSEVVGQVSAQHERVLVTVHGAPSAVLIAPADLEALEETIEILADRDSMRRLHDAEQEVAAGQLESEADLVQAMRQRRATSA